MPRYIKCPRCDLNYIDADTQEYCDICMAELGGRHRFIDLDDDTEEGDEQENKNVCSICGKAIPEGETMCEACKEKYGIDDDEEPGEDEEEREDEDDDEWKSYLDDAETELSDEEKSLKEELDAEYGDEDEEEEEDEDYDEEEDEDEVGYTMNLEDFDDEDYDDYDEELDEEDGDYGDDDKGF